MWTFVLSGILYLAGVGVVLIVKPSFMFTPDGQWKEFGVGKADDLHTPFPLWLFCIVWALVSYVLVLGVTAMMKKTTKKTVEDSFELESLPEVFATPPPSPSSSANSSPRNNKRFKNNANRNMPKGYYVLNRKASKLSGMPKYVYIGQNFD